MSKSPQKSEQTDIKPIDISVGIKRHIIDDSALQEFMEARERGDIIAQGSLVEYVKEKFYKEQNVVVVPDLSNQHIEIVQDLSGVDFSGAKLTGAFFQFCDLKGAIFCDADLSGVNFSDCEMQNVDMRGADLSFCKIDGFGEKWEAYKKEVDKARSEHRPIPEAPEELVKNYRGMRFSSTNDLMYLYGEINNVILKDAEEAFAKEKQEKLVLKEEEIAEAYQELSYIQSGYALIGETGNKKYDELVKERAQIERSILEKETVQYIIDPSLVYIPKSPENFDPGYVRGSSKKERDQEKQYVELTREDIEMYLLALKTTPDLMLNDFARSKAGEKGVELHAGSKVVAYAKYGTDLSNLDFTGANLQEACFAGAAFRKCNFTKANLNKAIFESAVVTGATFNDTKAEDVNFFHCFLDRSTVVDSSFKRSFMRGSNATGMDVNHSNFDYSNVRNGKWEDVNIQDATFNHADLEGISLANAKLSQVRMQHAMLERAILDNCEIIQSDLTGAFLDDAKARKAKFQDTILKDVTARGIDLSESKLDKLCQLEGVDLENAIMKLVEADKVNFVGSHMDGVNLEHAQMKEAVLDGVSMKFANLKKAVLEGAKANGVDLTGANLTDINAKESQFRKAILEGVEGENANFKSAVMEGANLRGANVTRAIFEKVNLKKADLRNAQLKRANLQSSEVKDIKINEGTDIHEAEITGVKGKAIHEGVDGRKEPMKLEEKKEIDKKVHDAEGKWYVSKLAGKVLNWLGGGCKKVANFIQHPISTKWGRIIGAVAGALIIGTMAASAVVTGGASLVVIAGVVAGAAVVGATVGAVAGHYSAKHIGLSTVVAAVVGGAAGGAPGVAAGAIAGVVVNQGVKGLAGTSIDEFGGNIIGGVGNGIKRLGEYIGISEEQERLLEAKKNCQKQYAAPKKEYSKNKSHGKRFFEQKRDQALMKDKSGIKSSTKTIKKTKQKGQSLKQKGQNITKGLQRVKKILGTRSARVEIKSHSKTKVSISREL